MKGICARVRKCVFPDLANTTDPHKGDALIGFKQLYPGATPRTVHDKLGEVLSVKDFGATDDAASVQATIAAIEAAGEVLFIFQQENTESPQT